MILGKAVGMNEWMGFINSEGKVENVEELKRLVHAGVCQRLQKLFISCNPELFYQGCNKACSEWESYMTTLHSSIYNKPLKATHFMWYNTCKYYITFIRELNMTSGRIYGNSCWDFMIMIRAIKNVYRRENENGTINFIFTG